MAAGSQTPCTDVSVNDRAVLLCTHQNGDPTRRGNTETLPDLEAQLCKEFTTLRILPDPTSTQAESRAYPTEVAIRQRDAKKLLK